MKLEISNNGGSSWTTLKSYVDGSDPYMQQESYDISAYASANTMIRFYSATSGRNFLLIDDFQVETNSMTAGDGLSYNYAVRDEFKSQSFAGNDGNAQWSGPWQELGESNGPGSPGRVITGFTSDCAPDQCLGIRGDWAGMGVQRGVDLSSARSARLSFDWRRSNFTGVLGVEVSRNGGATWTRMKTITNGNDLTPNEESFDITPFLSSNTQIRFMTMEQGAISWIKIDNVMIEF